MKKDKIEKLEEALQDVKELAKEFKKRNGNCSTNIPNKDMLFLLLTRSMDADRRIARLEASFKILFPIILTIIGLDVGGVI